MTDLVCDPTRHASNASWASDGSCGVTRIFVRAKLGHEFGTHDLACLDLPSLRAWMRSRGGENQWAEDALALVLSHELESK